MFWVHCDPDKTLSDLCASLLSKILEKLKIPSF